MGRQHQLVSSRGLKLSQTITTVFIINSEYCLIVLEINLMSHSLVVLGSFLSEGSSPLQFMEPQGGGVAKGCQPKYQILEFTSLVSVVSRQGLINLIKHQFLLCTTGFLANLRTSIHFQLNWITRSG